MSGCPGVVATVQVIEGTEVELMRSRECLHVVAVASIGVAGRVRQSPDCGYPIADWSLEKYGP